MPTRNGRSLLVALKVAAGRPGPQLQLCTSEGLRLRPVATGRERQCARDVTCLTTWRNRFVTSFLTEFVATEQRTSAWLDETVGPNDDRILFMIDDPSGAIAGYMGLGFLDWEKGYGEADAVVRGGSLPKGAMSSALRTLMDWSRGQLEISTLGVRVRSDNPALAFYRKLGFVEHRRVPLSCCREEDMIRWFENPEDTESQVALVHHFLSDS